jgi:hypothetical protein
MATTHKVFNKERKQDVATPITLWSSIHERFHDPCDHDEEWIDPCPLNTDTSIKGHNGLVASWSGSVFVNPPYKVILKWARKARREIYKLAVRQIVFLVPFNPASRWYKCLEHLSCDYKMEVFVLRERVAFQGYTKPFPMILCLVRLSHENPYGHYLSYF